jgi:DNA replication protein DnaC
MTRAPALVESQLLIQLRQLRMPGMAKQFPEVGRQARQEGWSVEEYLLELVEGELRNRQDSVVRQRLHEAGFPNQKTLDQFDFQQQPELSRDRVLRLARCEWVGACQPVLLVGPVGTGKTHLAVALGREAALRRYRVKFYRAEELVRVLSEAKSQHEVSRWMAKLDRYEVLILKDSI